VTFIIFIIHIKWWNQQLINAGLSNWQPTGCIRPATHSNPTHDYPPENVVHRPVLLSSQYYNSLFKTLFYCAVIFCLLCLVNKLTICWTEPVICKYSTTAVSKHSGNQSFNFKNTRPSYWGSVPKFYLNRIIPCQNVDTVR